MMDSRSVTMCALLGGVIVLAGLAAGCASDEPPPSPAVLARAAVIEADASAKSGLAGKLLADFELPDSKDAPVRTADLRGGWAVLYFFPSDDMPPCTCDATKFTKCLMEFQKVRGAAVYAITTTSPPNLRAFLESYKVTLNLLCDRDHRVMERCGAWADDNGDARSGRVRRSTLIVDPRGVVRHHWPVVISAGHVDRVRRKLAELQQYGTSSSMPAAP